MKILLTGASGVIGKSLLRMLSNHAELIDATFYKNSFEFISNDCHVNIIPYSSIINNNEKGKYDQIWHFATYGQPARFIDSWPDVVRLNVTDIQYLISLLKPDGHFFYASTSEMYGNTSSTELSIPASNPNSKRAVYTESKRLGEAILSTALPNQSTFFRICLAYSPDFMVGDRRVLYELVIKALRENKICLLDSGSSNRQYIYIDDAIKMMETIAFNIHKEPLDKNGPWNISNPSHITIYELALAIGSLLNKKVIKGPEGSNPHHALSTIDIYPHRYIKEFGNVNFTDLNHGLEKIIESALSKLKK